MTNFRILRVVGSAKVRVYRLEQAESDYRAICAMAGPAVEGARWSAKTLYYRLLARPLMRHSAS